jgi:hypothetical protein
MDEVDSAERVDGFCVVGMAAASALAMQGSILYKGWSEGMCLDWHVTPPARINAPPQRLPPCWCGGADRLTIPYPPVLDPALETFYSP